MYVANYSADSVSVINGATGAVIGGPIAVGSYPYDIAVNETTNRVYVANSGDDSVSVINGATGSVVDSIPVGDYPGGLAVNEPTNRVFVSNEWDDSVSVINGAIGSVDGTIAVGNAPWGAGVNEVTSRVYVVNYGGDSVSVIQDSLVVTKASIAKSPNKSKVTYKRKSGVAKFTLSAMVKVRGHAVAGRTVYLQSSKNGKSWKNTYKLKTSSKGRAGKFFKVKTKSVRYYRWYVPAKSCSTSRRTRRARG